MDSLNLNLRFQTRRKMIMVQMSTRPISNPLEEPLYVSLDTKLMSSIFTVKNIIRKKMILSTAGFLFA